MKAKVLPPVEVLWELFDYNPLTGDLIRRKSSGGQSAGSDVGWVDTRYKRVKINKKTFLLHRIIFKWVHGYDLGISDIDHINGAKDDNRFFNLRLVSRSQNCMNKPPRSDNKSGVVGVCFRKSNNRFRANIMIDGRYKHLGSFKTLEEAVAARKQAEQEHYGEFARTA